MERLFGTDGMRGEAGVFPLDIATIRTVGASLAERLTQKLHRAPLIVIGRDTRESGEWLEQALVAGLTSAGAGSQSAGVITTPGVAFLARTLPADAGVVISASHNPYRDNGIKIFAPSGRKLDEETERLIENDVFVQRELVSVKASDQSSAKLESRVVATAALTRRYLNFLANEVGRDLSLHGIRLVVDCANGAASDLAPQLFQRLGADLTTINNHPDGHNINLACGSLHTEALQIEVVKQKANLGVAFDGDADRALFVNANGRLVNGDESLWVFARYLQARHSLTDNTVVATVMSNIGLEMAFRSQGIRLVRTDVGDKYVLDELVRLRASLGGEQSGHIIFPRLSLAGDALITTLNMLRAMTEEGKELHELTEGFQVFPQILVNVEVNDKRPFANVPAIQKAAHEIETGLGSEGRLLLRYSGTEPLARVMIEGKHQEEIEKYAAELAAVIKRTLGAQPPTQ
ncbi:MAG TPA: phosphoglucosamine mutase [Pyrinomonadaceae bacterium]|nr:phosphoglucosamine mutase [Pyrinomonadaceae bacterium]